MGLLTRRTLLAASGAVLAGCGGESERPVAFLTVTHDPTRELFKAVDTAFAEERKQSLALRESHGPSAKQAQAVIEGRLADAVCLATAHEVDAIGRAGLIKGDWRTRLPGGSVPFTSTVVFLVRRGNPKAIADWDDLARPGVSVVMSDPRTCGAAQWAYLAAFGHGGADFLRPLYANAAVLPQGARGATMGFVKGAQDVLVGLESEALMASEANRGRFDIVRPRKSILAELPVALVDKVVERKQSREIAEAFLRFLYEPKAKDLIARHHFHPQGQAPEGTLLTVDGDFGGWNKAHADHFAPRASFDQVYVPPAPEPKPA